MLPLLVLDAQHHSSTNRRSLHVCGHLCRNLASSASTIKVNCFREISLPRLACNLRSVLIPSLAMLSVICLCKSSVSAPPMSQKLRIFSAEPTRDGISSAFRLTCQNSHLDQSMFNIRGYKSAEASSFFFIPSSSLSHFRLSDPGDRLASKNRKSKKALLIDPGDLQQHSQSFETSTLLYRLSYINMHFTPALALLASIAAVYAAPTHQNGAAASDVGTSRLGYSKIAIRLGSFPFHSSGLEARSHRHRHHHHWHEHRRPGYDPSHSQHWNYHHGYTDKDGPGNKA